MRWTVSEYSEYNETLDKLMFYVQVLYVDQHKIIAIGIGAILASPNIYENIIA